MADCCDCSAAGSVALWRASTVVEALVAKGISAPEAMRAATVERKLDRHMRDRWSRRGKQAARAAAGATRARKSTAEVSAVVRKAMKPWQGDVEPVMEGSMEQAYKLLRRAADKKAKGKIRSSLQYGRVKKADLQWDLVNKASAKEVGFSFDLADEIAIEELQAGGMMWVGGHYDENVNEAVRAAVGKELAAGGSFRDMAVGVETAVAETLANFSVPAGFHGTAESYFEGLAANTVTTARVRGVLRSFADNDVDVYELVNPMDRRTTQLCQHLNGKRFQVEAADSFARMLGGAKSPEEYKKLHPWLSYDQIIKLSPKAGHVNARDSLKLSKNGILIPPFHFRCRTVIDVVL